MPGTIAILGLPTTGGITTVSTCGPSTLNPKVEAIRRQLADKGYVYSAEELEHLLFVISEPEPMPDFAEISKMLEKAARPAKEAPRRDDLKAKPIRNASPRPRRNDRCKCGSGRKFKACCFRKQQNGGSKA